MSEHDEAFEFDDAAPEPFMASMLAAYREEEDIPSDAKARVQRRLESAPVVTSAEAAAASSRGLWIGAGVIAVVAALLVVPRLSESPTVPTNTAAQVEEVEVPAAPEPAPALEHDTAATPAPALASSPEAPSTDEPDATAEAVTPKPSKPANKARRRNDPEAPAPALSPADSLAEETALLRRAQAALSGHEPRKAFAILREHEQRFPDGVLAEERRALKVVALCDDGQVERGRKQAKAFLAKHAGSALRERVSAACPEVSK